MKIRIVDPIIHNLIKVFLTLIVGFYPLAFIYKDEYQIVPVTLEGVLVSLLLGVICNLGLFLPLTNFGSRWKKLTLVTLLLSAVSSCLIFYLPSANPISSLTDEGWFYIRHWFGFSAFGVVLFIMVLVGLHKNEG